MAWTPVQHPAPVHKYGVYGSPITNAFASPPAIGSLIIATGGGKSDAVTWAVSDNYSNGTLGQYAVLNIGTGNNFNGYIAYAVVTATGSGFTVSAADTGQNSQTIDIMEWSGGAGVSFDTSTISGLYINANNPVSATSTAAGDLAISVWIAGGAIGAPATPSGYTSIFSMTDAAASRGAAYKVLGAAGSETATWTTYNASEYTRAGIVLFKAGASGPTVTSVTQTSGGTEGSPAVMTVALSGATSGSTNFAATLAGVTATGSGTDFTSDLASATYSNGVTFSGGNIVVPDAVSGWTVTISTTGDTLDEANETATLTIGGTAGTLTITDDDAAPTITGTASSTVTAGDPVVITYSPGLSGQTRTYTLAFTDGTAVGGTDYDNTIVSGDFAVTAGTGSVSISGSTVTVDAGVTEFTLTITTTA